CWRRLYTDAVLYGAIAQLAHSNEGGDATHALLQTIGRLDSALVISGSPGPMRLELAHQAPSHNEEDRLALSHLHQHISSSSSTRNRETTAPSSVYPHPSPRTRLPPNIPRPGSQPRPPRTVHRPTRRRPFPRNGEKRAHTRSRWSDLTYLRRLAGPGRIVPVEVGGDYTQSGWGQKMMPFDEFLDSLAGGVGVGVGVGTREGDGADRPIYYLAQHSLFRQFPALVSDLLILDLVYSPPEHHYPSLSLDSNTSKETSSYEPPQSEEGYVLNAWFGPGGTKSAAHTDPWWNCYVQMAGSKWIWVAPPECGPYMAAFGKVADAESDGHNDDGSAKPDSGGGGAAEEYMTNTSSLDVTLPPPPLSPSDSDKPQPTSASPPPPPYPPRFLQHVLPHARQAVLEEGDVLVMPPRWWHAMVGLETSFSVSMWF
ncbi:Clavaminate synthase-like protein, partial [Rhodotorula sp. JG-1b]